MLLPRAARVEVAEDRVEHARRAVLLVERRRDPPGHGSGQGVCGPTPKPGRKARARAARRGGLRFGSRGVRPSDEHGDMGRDRARSSEIARGMRLGDRPGAAAASSCSLQLAIEGHTIRSVDMTTARKFVDS